MVLQITYYGNSVLRKKGKRIEKVTPEIQKIADDMLETMCAYQGVGLAAQQVGLELQMAVIDVSEAENRPSKMWINDEEVNPKDHMPMVLINPEIELIKTKEIDGEGCLSFPNVHGDISRSKRVKVKATDREGKQFAFEAAGLLGRAVQHEYDHLQGVLFIDRMDPQDRAKIKEEIEAVKEKYAQKS